MAVTGTITEQYTTAGLLKVTITGILQASTSPVFTLKGSPYTTAVVEGVFDTTTAPTVQWQGSNDGGTTWVSVGTSFTTGPNGQSLSPNQQPYELYQLLVTSGDAGTNLSVFAIGYLPR